MKIMGVLGCMTQNDLRAMRAMNITLDAILEAISINPIPKRIESDGRSGDGGPTTPPSHDKE